MAIMLDETDNFICTKFGYCYYSIEKDNSSAIIYNLYIYAEFRGQGKAKELLLDVIRKIRENNYTGRIKIEPNPQEGSISIENLVKFYESLGLIIIKKGS